MTVGRDTLSKEETITIAAVEAGVPTLVEAREIVAQFHLMIRRGTAAELSPWIERARASLVASFARRVTIDEAAVRAAITSPWSTEGQITRLDAARREAAYPWPTWRGMRFAQKKALDAWPFSSHPRWTAFRTILRMGFSERALNLCPE
jgi:hypothetical protein